MKARWIRLGTLSLAAFEETLVQFVGAQSSSALPVLLWGALGSNDAARYPFALIVPIRLAPGRRQRWLPWGLAAAVATYRQFGVPAYLDGEVFLHGRDIARSRAREMGECAVVSSSFLMRFPGSCVATPSSELEQAFRLRLEAQHGWEFDHSWPTRPECTAATPYSA